MNDLSQSKMGASQVIERSAESGRPGWLEEIRARAYETFQQLHWPQPDEEEWRRTILDGVSLDADRIIASLDKSTDAGDTGSNGSGRQARSNPAGLEVGRSVLEKAASEMDNRFTALNFLQWSDSRLVYVPAGTVLDEPVIIDYPGKAGEVNNIHTIVVLGREASATVIQRFSGGEPGALWNAGVSVDLGDAARLSFASIQHVDDTADFFQQYRFFLGNYSVLDSFECYTGGKLTKSRNEVFLEGSGSEARLNGVFYAKEGKHMDMRTVQYHRQRAGQSRAFFKGAVSENGRSIYQGLIVVDEKAKGTDAYLTNKNLILNDGARADSIPSLEIRTDDVKCSHGSTTGRIDDEALFYLMSRGLSRTEARRELIGGFFEELIEKAPEVERETVRSRILDLIQ